MIRSIELGSRVAISMELSASDGSQIRIEIRREFEFEFYLFVTPDNKTQALFPGMDWVEAIRPDSASHRVSLHPRSRNEEQDRNMEKKNRSALIL